MQRTVIVSKDEDTAQRAMDASVNHQLDSLSYDTFRRLMISKQMFENMKHTMVLEVDHGGGRTVTMPMTFPDKIASFYEYRNQQFGEETDARFFVDNPDKVMTSRKHLPTYKQIIKDVDEFNELYSGKFAKDGPEGAEKRLLRPHIETPPDQGSEHGYLRVIGEAELVVPLVLSDNIKFRFVITGLDGTDGKEKKTDWVRSKDLVQRSNLVFAMRNNLLGNLRAEIEKVGRGGQVRIMPHALLHQGISIVHATEDCDATEQFFSGKELGLKGDDHALLSSFSLFWKDMPNDKRALAIGSASVAFHARKANTDLQECHVCLGDIEGAAWKCGTCTAVSCFACKDLWVQTCIAMNNCTPSCPICRSAIEA